MDQVRLTLWRECLRPMELSFESISSGFGASRPVLLLNLGKHRTACAVPLRVIAFRSSEILSVQSVANSCLQRLVVKDIPDAPFPSPPVFS